MIAGIILAAGEARRMGQLKQLLPLGGKPMIWHVANAACVSRLDPVLLVTGAGSDAVVSSLQEFHTTSIHNENWADGQAGSVRTGIRDLPEETEAVLFLPADQPLISAQIEMAQRLGVAVEQGIHSVPSGIVGACAHLVQ